MKTQIYFFLLIFVIGCGPAHETKVNQPSHGIGLFQLNAKKQDAQHLEISVININPNAKGFAYADCPSTFFQESSVPANLRMNFSDTLIVIIQVEHKLVLYQLNDMGTGIDKQSQLTIYLENFFKVYGFGPLSILFSGHTPAFFKSNFSALRFSPSVDRPVGANKFLSKSCRHYETNAKSIQSRQGKEHVIQKNPLGLP